MQYLQAWSLLENYHEIYRGCKKLQKYKKVQKIKKKKNLLELRCSVSKSKTNTMFDTVLFFCVFFQLVIQIKIKQFPFVFLFTIWMNNLLFLNEFPIWQAARIKGSA